MNLTPTPEELAAAELAARRLTGELIPALYLSSGTSGLIIQQQDVGKLMEILMRARPVREEGWGDTRKIIPTQTIPFSIELVNSAIIQ